MWKAVWNGVLAIFGGSKGDKSIVEQTADIVDNYKPGEITQHTMSLEDIKAGDESQKEARNFQPQKMGSSLFDTIVDGFNRLPRPFFAFWAFGELAGLIPPPTHLNTLNPLVLNIIWTIIGFYFGIRTVTQDLPKLITAWKEMKYLK